MGAGADNQSIPIVPVLRAFYVFERLGRYGCDHYDAALRRHMHPISEAPDNCAELILKDENGFCVGQRWKHWSMPAPIWWSNSCGQVFPTDYVRPDTLITVGKL